MSKYGWLALSVVMVTFITIFAQQIEAITVSQELGQNLLNTQIDFGMGTVNGFFRTYVNLLTFNVTGLPAYVSLIFIPLNFVVLFILIELIIKVLDLIPFT